MGTAVSKFRAWLSPKQRAESCRVWLVLVVVCGNRTGCYTNNCRESSINPTGKKNVIKMTESHNLTHWRERLGLILYFLFNFRCVALRPSYHSDVRVGPLRVDAAVFLHVLEGVGHVSSPAAVVLCNTVHQVLGTEVQQFTRLLGQLALEGPGRAEGPAGTTGTLSGSEWKKGEWEV